VKGLTGAAVILKIKLRIHTAPGMTTYPTFSKSNQVKDRWEDPNPNNSSDWGKTSDRMDMRLDMGLEGHDLQLEGLGILVVRRCDGRGGGGHRGLSRTWWTNPPHTHTRAGVMRLGPEGCPPPINGQGWHARNRCRSQNEGS